MDSDYLKSVLITTIIGGAIYISTYLIHTEMFPTPKKKYYELTLSSGKVIKDSLKDYEDRLESDSISYYKHQIISSKEIK